MLVRLWSVLLGALLAVALVAPAEAEVRRSEHLYVSSGLLFASALWGAVEGAETPAGSPEMDGMFTVRPSGSSFTLTLDDLAALDGQTIQVRVVSQASKLLYNRCVPVRRAQMISAPKGRLVNVIIGAIPGYSRCTSSGSVGVATVVA